MKKTLFLLVFGLLWGYSYTFSAQLPDNPKELVFTDFSGGLNRKVPSHKLNINESPDLRNVYTDEIQGQLLIRNGYTLAGSTPTIGKISLMIEFNNDNGNREFIISDSSIVLTTKDFNTYTLIKRQLNTAYLLRAKQIRNKVWLTNGQDNVFTYDGTTTTVLDGQIYAGGKTPNVPKGKYIEEWLGRVWIYNTNTDNSAIYFSAVTSTDVIPIAIPPDNEWAWQASNTFSIGRGDGTIGTGMFVYSNQLHCAKERSIYTVFGEDEDTFTPKPTSMDVGVKSNESIMLMDNKVYFLGTIFGENAIFESNVANSRPISLNISDDIKNAVNNSQSLIANTWDKRIDFERGNYKKTTTTIDGEFVTLITSYTINYISSTFDPIILAGTDSAFRLTENSTFTSWKPIYKGNLSPNYGGQISSVTLPQKILGGSANSATYIVFLYNKNTNTIMIASTTLSGASFGVGIWSVLNMTLTDSGGTPLYIEQTDVDTDKIEMKIEIRANTADFTIAIASFNLLGYCGMNISTNCGQYISDVATITTINSWDRFGVTEQLNGGNIKYFYKTGMSPTFISTQVWTPITDNSIINSSASEKYVQWCATLNATNLNTPPKIDKVEIYHNEGAGVIVRPIAYVYKNRYWLNISSFTDGSSWQTYVKSQVGSKNPYGWTQFDNHNFYSFGKFSSGFYGGGNGQIFQIDYGQNDNGTAIDAYYDTPDVPLNSIFLDSTLAEYILDAEKCSGCNLTLGLSVDKKAFTDTSIDLDGSGRIIKPLKYPKERGNLFRWRFRNNQLDKGMKLNNFVVIYQPNVIRSDH